jgi:ubiquinone/menaquinone biosynthesis C-methylase UbiE
MEDRMSTDDAQGYFEEEARGYFDFLAKLGLTKHLGSMEATRRLVEGTHIQSGQRVLEVGCGVGATVPYLVRTIGGRVVGVDLLEDMVRQALERAQAERVGHRAVFAAADARRLPFEDAHFDAVIMESVNVFFEDKRAAMREYVRVTKPGGYVGITEMTWLEPPKPEVEAYYRRVVYAKALEAQGWIDLLEDVGLEDVVGNAYPVDMPEEARGRIERYGCRGMLRVMVRTFGLLFRDRGSRAFLKDVTGSLPQDLIGDMGYGVYVGHKRG